MSPKPVVVVPLQLFSTTNQPHKEGGVQQQIPTKLAVLSKGKTSKSSKGHHRGSHQRAGQHGGAVVFVFCGLWSIQYDTQSFIVFFFL